MSGVNRLNARLEQIRRDGGKALIPYITAGDPSPGHTVALMHALVDGGADVIELGVPFSDPMADGPVIQAACERALAHRVGLRRVLELVREFRQRNDHTPVVLMGYLNPVEAFGYAAFAEAAAEAGVDGVLLVDLSAEEAAEVCTLLRRRGLQTVFLVAPTTSDARLPLVCRCADGFVYYVARKGVTGRGGLDLQSIAGRLEAIRRHTRMPLAVGFGISDPAAAAEVGKLADAVVVGSMLVSEIAARAEQPVEAIAEALRERLAGIREALDGLTSTA